MESLRIDNESGSLNLKRSYSQSTTTRAPLVGIRDTSTYQSNKFSQLCLIYGETSKATGPVLN